jgi:flagellar motor switch protein FliG
MTKLGKLKGLKDRDIQNWLRKIDAVSLGIALLGADADVKNCVFKNMSERAVTILREDMEKYKTMDAKELIIFINAGRLEALL